MGPRSPISIPDLDLRSRSPISMPDESENRDDMTEEGFLDTLQSSGPYETDALVCNHLQRKRES